MTEFRVPGLHHIRHWTTAVIGCRSVSPVHWRVRVLSLIALGLSWGVPLHADDVDSIHRALDRITISDLKRHCGTLASDALEGREAGSRGGRAAAAYLQTELNAIPGLIPSSSTGWAQEFDPHFRNLIAVLPGSDPELRHEVILIGAHYDHVGRGNQSNSLGPIGYIHNGADDNASGTAALLELADAFASLKPAPRRTLVFAFWDAEEIGLLGSKHWVANPTHPLKNLRLVVNTDMLGRLRDGKLAVVGWRSAPGLRARLARHNSTGDLEYHFEPAVIADSDHHSFFAVGIPCLQLDTQKHEDYHRPTDDADKLNYQGIRRVAELVFRLVHEAAEDSELPRFRREALTESPPGWMSPRSQPNHPTRLGVNFDPAHFDQERAVVGEVSRGSAADKAGIRPGDRLLKVAHWDQGSMADLRTIVQTARNPVTVRLERSSNLAPLDLQLELAGQPVRVGIAWQTDGAIPDGVVITLVVPESPADRAGLKVGDIITHLSEAVVGSEDEIRSKLLNDPSPIRMRIERLGRFREIAVKLYDPLRP
jgi:acetylornithine deacetylase/succinyl-diaminopimelate desuccinylase-like protein